MIAAWGDGLLPVSFAVMAFAWMVMFGIRAIKKRK